MASKSAREAEAPQRSQAAINLQSNLMVKSAEIPTSRKLMGGVLKSEKKHTPTQILSEEEEDVGSDVDEEELLRMATPYNEEEEEQSTYSHEALYEVEALSSYNAQEDGDLSFKQREVLTVLESSRGDGWLLAENAIGERGLIPSNFVKQLSPPGQIVTDQAATSVTPRRGRDLWTKLRKTVNETSLGDVLCALGAIPSGFRDSTMARLLKDSSQYKASAWLKPNPSQTGMGFKDLKWNHIEDCLQLCPSKVSNEVTVYMAKNIPLPGKGVVVKSRHVRVAVFNKATILSNIHTVKAAWSPQEQKTWKFLPKSQTTQNSQYHRVLTVRLNASDLNLELLFEFAISFVRETTGEKGELSCGWCSLPLFDSSGLPTANKTYQLKLHGGTPFESGVEVDPSNIKVSGGRLVPSIWRTNQMPLMYVRMATPSKAKLAIHNLLPPTLIVPSTYNRAIGCFRHLAAVACLRGRLGLPLPSAVMQPALNVFLDSVNQSDIMDNLMMIVQEQLKMAKRANKKRLDYISEILEENLLQRIYPILTSPNFPSYEWDNESVEKQRTDFMESMIKRMDYSALLAPDIKQKAFQTQEQIFTIYS